MSAMSQQFMRLLALGIGLWTLALATPAVERRTAAAVNPTVTLSSGVVIGTATGVNNQPSNTGVVNAYLGVPFAQSPPLRFAPPAPAAKWSKPLKAQKAPPACLQQFPSGEIGQKIKTVFNDPFGPPPAESEDCLYLNVFAPQDAGPKNLKPVLFWIFGGNLAFGTGALPYYNGSSLAVNEDVVVVSINYRTNIFGFSNSPQIPAGQQNSGFLDQRFALQWVQQNIARFGGDPSQVTIFGESAGGYSVKQLLAQPPSPLPFRAAILESQQALFVGNGRDNYNNVLAHFNCSKAAEPLTCIRKVKGTDIRDYISNQSLLFAPVDDKTHTSNALPSIVSGKFADVPVLIGTNHDEASAFLYAFGIDPASTNASALLAPLGFDLPTTPTPLSAPYPSLADDSFELLTRIVTDLLFTCTTQTFSSAISAARRQPVWRYRYDPAFPELSGFPNAGAFHSVEIPEVFGTYPLSTPYGSVTANQTALSSYMQGVWGGFARGQEPDWPRLGSKAGVELALLGSDRNATGRAVVPLLTADYPCVLYGPLLVLLGRAY